MEFATIIVILIGQLYWIDRKLTGVTKELTELKVLVATIGQKLDDHISSH